MATKTLKDYLSKDKLYSLYWDDFLTLNEIGKQYGVHGPAIMKVMKKYGIPRRFSSSNTDDIFHIRHAVCNIKCEKYHWNIWDGEKWVQEHRYIVEKELGIKLGDNDVIHHKDENPLNNHPLNLAILSNEDHTKLHATRKNHKKKNFSKISKKNPWFRNYMIFASLAAMDSHCSRGKVGCVITNFDLDKIYATGLNGNGKKMYNGCDSDEPGKCGCIHAEQNALIKVRDEDKKKVIFTTTVPCLQCTKLIINSGCSYLYYGDTYRDSNTLKLLHYHGIRTCPYPTYVNDDFDIVDVPYYEIIEKSNQIKIVNAYETKNK